MNILLTIHLNTTYIISHLFVSTLPTSHAKTKGWTNPVTAAFSEKENFIYCVLKYHNSPSSFSPVLSVWRPQTTTFKASFHNNANPSPPPARKTHRQATQIFLCERSYGLSLLNVSWLAGEALHPPRAIHQHSPRRSHLTSEAIMPHQVGQLPSLAAEQRAQAGSKIKYAAAGFHSQEQLGLPPYWLRNFAGKDHKQ